MFPLVCQLCKEITHNGSLCNKCFRQNYKLNQINNWNIWIKETPTKKKEKVVRISQSEKVYNIN